MTTSVPPSAQLAADEPDRISDVSLELWKFFEERGGKLKDSMFGIVTWMVGLASVVLGFAVKEGFAERSALTSPTHAPSVIGLSLAGLLILRYANVVIDDYGEHINRAFERADAAKNGERSARRILQAGQSVMEQPLPPFCRPLRRILALFAWAFVALMILALLPFLLDAFAGSNAPDTIAAGAMPALLKLDRPSDTGRGAPCEMRKPGCPGFTPCGFSRRPPRLTPDP